LIRSASDILYAPAVYRILIRKESAQSIFF
jgi:hypothetical protein